MNSFPQQARGAGGSLPKIMNSETFHVQEQRLQLEHETWGWAGGDQLDKPNAPKSFQAHGLIHVPKYLVGSDPVCFSNRRLAHTGAP